MDRSASPDRKTKPRASHLELAQQILEHVRSRGLGPGAHLPEQVLASACNVSRTPVRAALDLLVDQGLARHETSTGYRLASDFSPASVLAGQLPNAVETELAGRILRDRAARRLDETVTVGGLIRRYGAARSAVAKAVARLAEDGLLSRAPGQSWVFAPLPDAPESQADSFEFRLMLEPEALSAPGFKLDPDRAAALRRAMVAFLAEPDDRLDPRGFQALDAEFHGLIARGAANRFVAEALTQHLRLRELPGATARANVVRLRQAMQEHLSILDQLEAGRFDVAADLLRVHLRLSRSQRPQAANRGAPPLFGLTFRGGGDG
ncbi:GntR family transcriptional regulator [Defluviimonas sp. WL0002]|uniref:GntR family transcriptional regulator n=1 Tax=Albidovulum marisflavi TaxID=2984159 RepID=A0ABT2ZD06_9RHOB|nr:GntR family transcriptional regulator [Defluviimonas sp. WL0002]MCV2869009.1 GntR family transcriptional regulator [Defluviimonas sp. WL0002]